MAASVVGFVGLDEVSLGLAASLLRSGHAIQAFEASLHLTNDFSRLGGKVCTGLNEASQGVCVLFIFISNVDQIPGIFFDYGGVLTGLPKDVIIILHTTILPVHIQDLEKNLRENYQMENIVDLYVIKPIFEVSNGEIVVVSSGQLESTSRAKPILSAISERVFICDGDIGSARKIKMVIELLEGVHFVASLEALSLGTNAGIHPWIIHDIISNAAGSSWVFKNYISHLLRADQWGCNLLSALDKNLGIVLEMANYLVFPLPLLTVAHQQIVSGCSQCLADNKDAKLLKLWEKLSGVNITDAAHAKTYSPAELSTQLSSKFKNINRIGFIGLGAMGFGMATHLLKSNFNVTGYDIHKPVLSRFENEGGITGSSPSEVSKDVDAIIIMVTNEQQAESVLFGDCGVVSALPFGASIILSSTVSPAFVNKLERRLQDEQKGLKLVDAPVSGGVKKASDGTLTIMASGSEEALQHVGSVLSALSEKFYIINGACGAGSAVKMINQLLAGVHIASTAEAIAFGARLGINTRLLFEIIKKSPGTSWMFENRGPHMLENDYTPLSALDIFVKDLGIVSRECYSRKVPLPVSNVAYQLFLAGSAAGWGRMDDSAVVKVYETLTGVKVEGNPCSLSKESVFQSLPSEWPVDPVGDIVNLTQKGLKTLVVLDDDPTGTQTVHDIHVLTEWSVESLVEEFSNRPKCFFILTNSRSLSSDRASRLIVDICRNLSASAKAVDKVEYTVVLRGDSTLRGHFPEEADAVVSVIGEMDAWIICPFFFQGGRYTIGDVHYVEDSDRLIPAGETEFAKDASFGYKSSNLREWIEEKTRGCIPASSVSTISIQLLRKGGPEAVYESLCSLRKGATCIVNAASERDISVFAAGMIKAELKGKSFLCQTAASFVSARIGIIPKARLLPSDLGIIRERHGGLIVVGSYVPKTTKQVEELLLQRSHDLKQIDVSVERIALNSTEEREEEIKHIAEIANIYLKGGKDTLIMTSRQLVVGRTAEESLEVNARVSSALVEIVRNITERPHYILAKGGITSSDLVTKALEAKRARIVGQVLAGVPLWQLGPESRHPGLPYIVFPGNVGDSKAVAEVVRCWAHPGRLSTRELLLNAEKGGYAVGAFNVYNLEGVTAVISAAEEERSPAILQIHPSAWKQGGVPLLACCIAAAKQATVPVTVHFDHGSSKQELLEIMDCGLDSVMVDGSHLPLNENIAYTKYISILARSKNLMVEAELGRMSGTEDDLTVEDYEARLTDVNQADEFIEATGIGALAVCIGNVHGKYPANGPNLRLDLLQDLYDVCGEKGVYLVLHGASGLTKDVIQECIKRGVRKFNVNTEVRKAYMESLNKLDKDLMHVMISAKEAMKAVVAEKMRLFGSAGKA